MRLIVLTLLCLFVCAVPAMAQGTVSNPTKYEFDPSVDHAAIDTYELAIFDLTDILVATLNIGKPAVEADGKCRGAINVQPIKFGEYVAKVRARAVSVFSPWSDPSNQWTREPGKPGKPLIIK